MANSKPVLSMDEIVHDQLDQPNKLAYYKEVEGQIKDVVRQGQTIVGEVVVKEEIEKYQESFRSFYYTSEILTNNKSNQFFQDIVRQMHPTLKIKGPIKNLLKTVTKIYTQELAETCLQLMTLSGKSQVDVEVVGDAYRLIQKRRGKNNKVSSMFSYLY